MSWGSHCLHWSLHEMKCGSWQYRIHCLFNDLSSIHSFHSLHQFCCHNDTYGLMLMIQEVWKELANVVWTPSTACGESPGADLKSPFWLVAATRQPFRTLVNGLNGFLRQAGAWSPGEANHWDPSIHWWKLWAQTKHWGHVRWLRAKNYGAL